MAVLIKAPLTSISATTTTHTTSSATTSPPSEPNQLLQLRVHNLLGLGQHGHQVFCLRCVVGFEEGVAGSSVSLPTSSTLTKNIMVEDWFDQGSLKN